MKKNIAEFIGTFWLVFTGCGSAVLAASYPELGIGFVGVSLAFGFSIITMAYSIGSISGCHLNPAVTIGMLTAQRIKFNIAIQYILSQVLGGLLAAGTLFSIVTGSSKIDVGSFAANGYGEHSPLDFDLVSCFTIEMIMTFFFVLVILFATTNLKTSNFSGLVIGLTLSLIHLVSIPVTNTSVNPARSTSQAFFAEYSWPFEQLWLFWLAPILGAIIAGFIYKYFRN